MDLDKDLDLDEEEVEKMKEKKEKIQSLSKEVGEVMQELGITEEGEDAEKGEDGGEDLKMDSSDVEDSVDLIKNYLGALGLEDEKDLDLEEDFELSEEKFSELLKSVSGMTEILEKYMDTEEAEEEEKDADPEEEKDEGEEEEEKGEDEEEEKDADPEEEKDEDENEEKDEDTEDDAEKGEDPEDEKSDDTEGHEELISAIKDLQESVEELNSEEDSEEDSKESSEEDSEEKSEDAEDEEEDMKEILSTLMEKQESLEEYLNDFTTGKQGMPADKANEKDEDEEEVPFTVGRL